MIQKYMSSSGSFFSGRGIRTFLVTGFLVVALLLTNVLQVVSVIIRPFSKKTFRLINRHFANNWWGWCVIAYEKVQHVQIQFEGDSVPRLENALVIGNHQAMVDIPAVMSLAIRKGRLGDMKFFVKSELKWTPGLGWGMYFLDCLFVKRNWDADKDYIHSIFNKFSEDQIPIWLISFVEGTRLTPEKLKRAQEYSKKSGLPVLQNTLFPRTKGFVASLIGLRAHFQAVYDLTIIYPQGIPTLWQFLSGEMEKMIVWVKRFPIEQLPHSESEIAQWLIQRFVEKDVLLQKQLTSV